jgi:menaquinone-dependent protoporphyrinogen oxidase
MCELPVFYATTEGQTLRVATRLAAALRGRGLASTAMEVRSAEAAQVDWAEVRGAAVGASVHVGRHQPEVVAFVQAHATDLNAVPSAFFSVSLNAGSPKPAEVESARGLAQDFVAGTPWTPRLIRCFAGRLAYTQYGFFKRLLMWFIARRTGWPADTSRDHEFTDWTQVIRFADEIADAAGAPPLRRRPSGKPLMPVPIGSIGVQSTLSPDAASIPSGPSLRRAG